MQRPDLMPSPCYAVFSYVLLSLFAFRPLKTPSTGTMPRSQVHRSPCLVQEFAFVATDLLQSVAKEGVTSAKYVEAA
jgi:hypothetical protein